MMPNLGEREGATGKKLRPQCESCKQDRVPFGKAVNATAIAQRKARIGSRHVAAHASASAQSMDEDVVIDHAAAAAAKKAAEVHAAAAAKAQADEAALGAAVPMQAQIQDGQEQLAKRQKPRRGYCLDVGVGGWYEGNVSEEVGVGTYKMNHDHYEAAAHVPRHRIVADEDILFITYEEVADPDPEQIFRCEVSIRDVGGEKTATARTQTTSKITPTRCAVLSTLEQSRVHRRCVASARQCPFVNQFVAVQHTVSCLLTGGRAGSAG